MAVPAALSQLASLPGQQRSVHQEPLVELLMLVVTLAHCWQLGQLGKGAKALLPSVERFVHMLGPLVCLYLHHLQKLATDFKGSVPEVGH